MSKKTLALVGMATTHREQAPFDDSDIDIWILNEMGHTDSVRESEGEEVEPFAWIKRWDAVFQLHQRWDFTRSENFNDPEHFEWLKTFDGPQPIYMQEEWDDIPQSEEYPLDKVAELVAHVRIGEQSIKFFSATFPYMVALAVHLGYERIELYGFELNSETEWAYQRPSALFWLGFAAGRDIEIWAPENCTIFNGRLYGYEGGTLIPKPVFVERRAELDELRTKVEDEMQEQSNKAASLNVEYGSTHRLNKTKMGELERRGTEINNAQQTIIGRLNAIAGAIQENDYWIGVAENIEGEENQVINRQHLEIRGRGLKKRQDETIGILNKVNGELSQVFKSLKEKSIAKDERRRREKLKEALAFNRSQNMGQANAVSGALRENERWIKYCDQLISVGGAPEMSPEDEEVEVQIAAIN